MQQKNDRDILDCLCDVVNSALNVIVQHEDEYYK